MDELFPNTHQQKIVMDVLDKFYKFYEKK